jgi:hypothetical protein
MSNQEENSKYPKSDWQYEVKNGDTSLGYQEWVEHCIERDQDQDDPEPV